VCVCVCLYLYLAFAWESAGGDVCLCLYIVYPVALCFWTSLCGVVFGKFESRKREKKERK